MATINEVFTKAKELCWQMDSLIRLSTFNDYDDLSGLNINYEDAEQIFLLDELRSVMNKLADVQDKISYLSRPIKETSRLHKNDSGKYETQSSHYYSCGYGIEALGQKMVTDTAEWSACDGKVYLTDLFDCYDNMCLGIAIADNMRTELCIQTYQQAAENYELRGAISHSDCGSQYTSEAFHQTLVSMGILQSMNNVARRCHDNAKCESM